MPAGFTIMYPRDNSEFVKTSIREVIETLVIAIALVVVVMYLFLQSWRATLVPAIAVPVVLLGTFGILALFGYSINTLTLFGMVLAIGLLVDDAIVVVENVERLMADKGWRPIRPRWIDGRDRFGAGGHRAGAFRGAAADGVFRRLDGVIYRQFSITIVASMLLSVVVALVLRPRCAPPC
jgi:multidrug efflux pump